MAGFDLTGFLSFNLRRYHQTTPSRLGWLLLIEAIFLRNKNAKHYQQNILLINLIDYVT
jgi:hypothetical protein